jgi:hypothetical protein
MDDPVDITISGTPLVLADWLKAKRAASDVLPKLSAAQANIASKFGISEESYARSVLANQYGTERVQKRAEKFVTKLNGLLQEIKIVGRVARLHPKTMRNEQVWIADISTQAGSNSVQIPNELFEDVVDAEANSSNAEMLKLKLSALLRQSLNLGDAA